MNKKKGIYLLAFLLFIFSLGLIISFHAPLGQGEKELLFHIPKGVGASFIAKELAKESFINNANYFRLYLSLRGWANEIQAGDYELNNSMWLGEIAKILVQGKVRLVSITIPEGWNNRQLGDYLSKEGYAKSRADFLSLSRDPKILKKYKIMDASTEGYLFPNTYKIPPSYTDKEIHILLLNTFFKVIKELGAYKKYKGKELRDRIILASIVEREARHSKERPVIARVFLNRLEKGIKLESCATVQYLFEKSKAKLYYQDLARPSPYNTYIHYGLPLAPISNPGKEALKATFYPEENKYLYFVVKPDASHHFSETYAGHLKAKKKYIDSDLVPSQK